MTWDVTQSSWVEQSSIVARFLLCAGQLAGWAELWCGVLWWTVVAGPLLRVEPVFGETQEEQLSGIRWNGVACRVAVTMCCRTKFRSSEEEQRQWRWSKLLHSFNKSHSHWELKLPQNLDFQTQCERSTISRQLKFGKALRVSSRWKALVILWQRGGISTVVEEDGGILRWCDQGVWDDVGVGSWTGDWNHDDSDWSRVLADEHERGQRSAKNGVCCSRCIHHPWLSRVMKRMILSPTRGRTQLEAWRRLQKRYDPTTGGRKWNLLRTIIFPGRCSLLELQAVFERWESYVSRNQKKLKDKMDDWDRAGWLRCVGTGGPGETPDTQLESLANFRGCAPWNRDVRGGEIRFENSRFQAEGARGHSDPMDVDAVNCLSSGKGKGSSSPRDGCFKCGGAHFQRDCNARKSTGKQSSGKGT